MNSHVDMPAHHIGFRRYVRDSDDEAAPYAAARLFASLSPCAIARAVETRIPIRSQPVKSDLFCNNEAGPDGERA